MKPKKNTQAYLKQCIKLFIESHHKFLDSFDIEKSLKKDKNAVKIITNAIKQRFKTFKSGQEICQEEIIKKLVLYVWN